MPQWKWLLLIVVTASTGCRAVFQIGKIPDKNHPETCGQYIPPKLGVAPSLPLLTDSRGVAKSGLDAILANHIVELRKYITDSEKKNDAAYRRYLRSCSRADTSH